MSRLNRYLETILVAGHPLSECYKAYKIDGESPNMNMRNDADLGGCHSCDYFLVSDGFIYLIEETRLSDWYRNMSHEYDFLESEVREKLIEDFFLKENELKVYASMLVLCRFSAKYRSVASQIRDKTYNFWLVISDISDEDFRFADNLKEKFFGILRSLFSKDVMHDVEIIPSAELSRKLREHNIAIF